MTKVWVVQGSSGEYSDHSEWLVAYYRTEKEAQVCVEFLSVLGREGQKIYEEYTKGKIEWKESDRRISNLIRPFDSSYSSSYSGTNYNCFEVDLGMDFSKVELTEEKIQMLQNVGKETQ